MNKKIKTGLIIGGILIFLAFIGMLSGGEEETTNNTPEPPKTVETTPDYTNTLTYSSLLQKSLQEVSDYLELEPTLDESTPPVVSTAVWENDTYEVYAEYNKGEEVIYGGIITAKVYTCNDSGVNKEDVENILSFVNIKDVTYSDLKKITEGKETYYQARDLSGYKSITVRCDGKHVYINPLTTEYWDWTMEK